MEVHNKLFILFTHKWAFNGTFLFYLIVGKAKDKHTVHAWMIHISILYYKKQQFPISKNYLT